MSLQFDHAASYAAIQGRRPELELEFAAVDGVGRILGYRSTVILLDSGADVTLLNADLARFLGIDLTRAPVMPLLGVGGQTAARLVNNVLVRLCGHWTRIPVAFQPGRDVNLLGRQGAFSAMQVAFVHRHGLVVAARST